MAGWNLQRAGSGPSITNTFTPAPAGTGAGINPGGAARGLGSPSAPSGVLTPAPGQPTADQTDANAIIGQLLDAYGLQSLSGWVWQQITQGASANQIDLALRQTPEFRQRFPGLVARQNAGLPPISPGEYVSYEDQARQLERQYGMTPGSIPVDQFIGGDTSINEVNDRIQKGLADYMQAPQEYRDAMQRYGVSPGDAAHFFLDPNAAEPNIMRKYNAAKIAGQAAITGYAPSLDEQTAGQLVAQGVSDAQAAAGFTHLGAERQLFGALPGTSEQNIGQAMQLGAEFGGNADDQAAILARQRGRLAPFQGGGSFAGGQGGATGTGSANQT